MGTVKPRRFPLAKSTITRDDSAFVSKQKSQKLFMAGDGPIVGSAPTAKAMSSLPKSVDFRPDFKFYPPEDQEDLNSCTSFAISSAIAYLAKTKFNYEIKPSELFIYYNERVLEGEVDENSVVFIKNGMIATKTEGACEGSLWPYNVAKFKEKPPVTAYDNAKHVLTATYQVVDRDQEDIKESLADGIPIIIGMAVYPYFNSQKMADTGKMVMPVKYDIVLGGHAVLIVGYDDSTEEFIIRNSFGTDWGMEGYFTLPYAFFNSSENVADLWRINSLTISQ